MNDPALLELTLRSLGAWPQLTVQGAINVEMGTQAQIWRWPAIGGSNSLALRLVQRPRDHMVAVALAWENLGELAPQHHVTVSVVDPAAQSGYMAQLMEWVDCLDRTESAPRLLGEAVADMHGRWESVDRFRHRPLNLGCDLGMLPKIFVHAQSGYESELKAWHRLLASINQHQPIHGDLHDGNVLRQRKRVLFIDFDKMMYAPREFDLAKLLVTSAFRSRSGSIVFLEKYVYYVLAGYAARLDFHPAALLGAIWQTNVSLAAGHAFRNNLVSLGFRTEVARWLASDTGRASLWRILDTL